MNTAAGLGLFLVGSFALIIFAIRTPAIEFYTGGIVIALFVGGLFLAFGLTIEQTKKIASSDDTLKNGVAQSKEATGDDAKKEEEQQTQPPPPAQA